MDVASLYMNIDIHLGLGAGQQALAKYPEEGRPDTHLIHLLEHCLTRNDFEFRGRYYLQLKDTAMGKQFTPAYANIYMAEWEQGVLVNCAGSH